MARTATAARTGPVTLLTLVAVLALAVLAVLAFTTANANLTMSTRQAAAAQAAYAAEAEANAWLADVSARQVEAAAGTAPALAASDLARDFALSDGRTLHVALSLAADGTLAVTEWRLSAAAGQPQSPGTLWTPGG